jgi:hypothetical protein
VRSRAARDTDGRRRAPPPRRAKGGVEPLVDAHEGAAADGDGVRGEVWVEVVVGQLEPGHQQQVVLALGSNRLRLDLGEVVAVIASCSEFVHGRPRGGRRGGDDREAAL